jgi:hypothetical protein
MTGRSDAGQAGADDQDVDVLGEACMGEWWRSMAVGKGRSAQYDGIVLGESPTTRWDPPSERVAELIRAAATRLIEDPADAAEEINAAVLAGAPPACGPTPRSSPRSAPQPRQPLPLDHREPPRPGCARAAQPVA